MIRTDIIQKFNNAGTGFLVDPQAVAMIQEYDIPYHLMDEILKVIDDSVVVIEPSHVAKAEELLKAREHKVVDSRLWRAEPDDGMDAEAKPERTELRQLPGIPAFSRPTPHPITVLADITENSTCVGTYEEFVRYFRDRYDRLSEIIKKRLPARPIESLTYRTKKRGSWLDEDSARGEKLSIIGMVSDIRDTVNGHRILVLEDPTGYFNAIALKGKDAYEAATHVIYDEVIGVTGSVSSDGNVLFVDSITWPDVPPRNEPRQAADEVYAVLMSDVHVGSKTFLTDAWKRFVEWVSYGEDETAQRVAYVLVAGDLVDGIGVFPNQEDELALDDINDQYTEAAALFDMLPSELSIIIAPGNHDAVRQAEPQPAISSDYVNGFGTNVTFVGNPALIEIHGVKALMYHGRSLDDIIATIPGTSYSEPDKAMTEMLKRRHLSPIYGNRVSIAPENTDHFVIGTVPDILHSGHVHTIGASNYMGVTVVNSGAWQGQTKFQKSQNINPRPGIVPVCNLKTMDVSFINFTAART
jgi:DNA polymerase II small subunit